MSTVHFVDTSVFVSLLNVPGLNEHYEEAKEEHELFYQNGDDAGKNPALRCGIFALKREKQIKS